MTMGSLAERTGISERILNDAVEGADALSDDEVELVADALGVPVRSLFANSKSPLSSLPDFRRLAPKPSLMDPGTIKAIAYVEKISLSLAAIGLDLSASPLLERYAGQLTKDSARSLAAKWRKAWGMTDKEQLEMRDANKLYKSLRGFIEWLGVFVMHYSFGTDEVAGLYAKVDGGPHTIVVNTTSSSKARKLFTLAHEFCHALLRADGISNPSVALNKIEVFCNQFAAYLLAPDGLIRRAIEIFRYEPSIDTDMIRLLAKNLGISQQACVVRLVDLDLLDGDDYGRWMKRFSGPVPDGDLSDGPSGGPNDPILTKTTHFGTAFLAKLSKAYKDELLDAIEIYRLAGIKPKYQKALLGI